MPRSAAPGLTILALALVLSACGSQPATDDGSDRFEVTIDEDGCQPSTIEVASGRVVFEVTNGGGDVGEFEILRGTTVVDEVESIVPGFVINFATLLDGGSYELVCYSLRSPRGTLTVTGGAAPSRPASNVVDAETLAGYQAEYLDFVQEQSTALVLVVEPFVAAIEEGDLEAAKAAYAPSRVPWEQIEPVAELFADLDTSMDAREEDFAGGVDDPEFVGWHRLEKGIFSDGSTDGLEAIAAGLREDAAELERRLAELEMDPRVMARGAGELIEEVAQSKLTGEEDRYSQADLWSIQANVDGSRKIVEILQPTIDELDAEYGGQVDAAFDAVNEIIAGYATDDGFERFSEITDADLRSLQAAMANLSELLSRLPGLLGLEA